MFAPLHVRPVHATPESARSSESEPCTDVRMLWPSSQMLSASTSTKCQSRKNPGSMLELMAALPWSVWNRTKMSWPRDVMGSGTEWPVYCPISGALAESPS